ncbi:hypothetical protein [Nevskia sp.]|uniref:hypothetical protein n=1 Tax=Nevskia sp. TaxID=1929292 RepID=UPI0025D177E8|nr:hypothetical protein [Nevskia sp.]
MLRQTPTLAVDLHPLSCGCTDLALEALHKSLADPPDSNHVWEPHPDPLLRETVEHASHAGTASLRRLFDDLIAHVRELSHVRKAFTPDRAVVAEAIIRLRGKSSRQYDVDDWLTLIDWLMLQYLPDAFFKTQAEYLTVRAAAAAKIQASHTEADGALVPVQDFAARMPVTPGELFRRASFSAMELTMLRIAQARAAEAMTVVGEATRHRIKQLVVNHLQASLSGDPLAVPKRLERQLFDEFSILNRDWRRVAITEAGNARSEGMIGGLAVGTVVRRFEAYAGACDFCRKINGKTFTVVDASNPDKDGATQVWVGKTNVGRSSSPRKRVGDELVDRTEDEKWWVAAGTQHPNCRGGWSVVSTPGHADDKTRDFVNELLKKHGIGRSES